MYPIHVFSGCHVQRHERDCRRVRSADVDAASGAQAGRAHAQDGRDHGRGEPQQERGWATFVHLFWVFILPG